MMRFPESVPMIAVLDASKDLYEKAMIVGHGPKDGVEMLELKFEDGTIIKVPSDAPNLYILH